MRVVVQKVEVDEPQNGVKVYLADLGDAALSTEPEATLAEATA